MLAIYATREVQARYFNGAGYVVREDMHPHTDRPGGKIETRQGRTFYVGARQGADSDAGFTIRRYGRSPFSAHA